MPNYKNKSMMLNCVIIDDDKPCQKITQELIQKSEHLNLIHTFSSPVEALNAIQFGIESIDMLFLDIEMPDMNGLEFIQSLQKKIPAIILTTSHKEFAMEAFENHVLDYLVKPLNPERFSKAILKARNAIQKKAIVEDVLFIKNGNERKRIKIQGTEILYLKADGDYVHIYTAATSYTIYSTLNAIEEKLLPKTYMRVHRSFIVRIDKIEFFDDSALALKNSTIPIGPKYKEELFKQLTII